MEFFTEGIYKKPVISGITIAGYKSILNESRIDIVPLTILAGTNSSGKSSSMQPILLLKQTLEATYDPGVLKLDGPNVRFTQATQLFHKKTNQFRLIIHLANNHTLGVIFEHKYYGKSKKTKSLQLAEMSYSINEFTSQINKNTTYEDIEPLLDNIHESDTLNKEVVFTPYKFPANKSKAIRDRCFFEVPGSMNLAIKVSSIADAIRSVIHVPGLRGNPERTYAVTGVGSTFPGTFDNYTASIIAKWQEDKDTRLSRLSEQLTQLGLTHKVEAAKLDDTRVELRVALTSKPSSNGAAQMVSVADVGFGVSQTLPVLVALLAARPNQLVYIEQPEIHLHPRAQVAMASIIAEASKRGVRVVIETHSSLLLLAVQTLIAEGNLAPELVKLHWFERDDNGETTITTADIDEAGAFGDWPVDFGDVELDAHRKYLDAADEKMLVHVHRW